MCPSLCTWFRTFHYEQAKFRWERPGGPPSSFELELQPANGALRGREVYIGGAGRENIGTLKHKVWSAHIHTQTVDR